MRGSILEFAATREVMASLYAQTPIATLLCEPRELRIAFANPAAEALLACTAPELSRTAWPALVSDASKMEESLRAALSGNRSTIELQIWNREGATVEAACDVFPARAGNDVVGVFVHIRGRAHALSDPLTGLPGRIVLEDRVEQALVTARRYRYRFAIIIADIDGFRELAERYGVGAGDWVVRVVAQRVRQVLRRSDTVVRSDTDRFVVLQPLVESVEDAVDVAHKIVFAMHAPITIDAHALDVRLSLGIAMFPTDGETRADLTAAANAALRDAKRNARGLFRVATNSAMAPAT